MVPPSRLEHVSGYPRMTGGFGVVRVAKLDASLMVAVKEIRIGGIEDDPTRFAIVRPISTIESFCLIYRRDLPESLKCGPD